MNGFGVENVILICPSTVPSTVRFWSMNDAPNYNGNNPAK